VTHPAGGTPKIELKSLLVAGIKTVEKNNNLAITLPKLFEVLSAIDKTVLEMISSGTPLSDVLSVLCQIIEERSPGLLCSILLLDPNRKSLRHGAAPSLPDSYTLAIDGITIGPRVGSCGTAAYRAEPVIVMDIATDPLWSDYRDLALSHGLRACWSTPIISKDDKVLGTFALYYCEPRGPSQEDLQVIERATHLAAIAIERQRAEAERQVMFEIIQGVNVSANLDELFHLIHQSLKKVIFAENFFVALYDRRSGLFTFPFFVDQFDPPPPSQKLEKSCTAYVFRAGRPMIITQEFFDQLAERGEVELVGTPGPTLLGVPLKTPKETIGVLVAQHYEDGNAYTERELEFMASVGGQIAVAIDRKRAEEELRAAETRFRTLVEQLPAITYVAEFGAAGPWSYVSPQIETLLGFSPAEWMTDSEAWVKCLHPEDRERVLGEEEQSQHSGEPFRSEYRMIARDGRVLWCRDEATVMSDQAMKRNLMLGVIHDITQRRQLEEQLRQSQKMEAVGRLAGGVAHDFNNLLMIIKGNSEMMIEHLGATERWRKNAGEIDKAADKAASLTRQLLAFSRMQVIQPKLLDLNGVVGEMAKMLGRLIGDHIELNIVSGASPGAVKADQGQIEQVLMNLVINGRDAMPEGGRLTIETANVFLDGAYARQHTEIQPGNYVMMAVSDNGVGMDAETQAHIFEPFFTTKELGKGTGLGLATVYGAVKQNGGWIWVYSEPGRGTTFKIYLPQVEQVVSSPGRSRAVGPPLHGSETILLVEDQDAIRNLASEFLKGNGYNILEAGDGREALQVAEQHHGEIDLLLTDVVMPRMGGLELAVRLANLHPQMKVIYMSGYAEYAKDNRKLADSERVILQKPFALDTLARKVREVLAVQGRVALLPK
jgi:two-component system, cell cycle sensor histidine kinase and response regulator CckA